MCAVTISGGDFMGGESVALGEDCTFLADRDFVVIGFYEGNRYKESNQRVEDNVIRMIGSYLFPCKVERVSILVIEKPGKLPLLKNCMLGNFFEEGCVVMCHDGCNFMVFFEEGSDSKNKEVFLEILSDVPRILCGCEMINLNIIKRKVL